MCADEQPIRLEQTLSGGSDSQAKPRCRTKRYCVRLTHPKSSVELSTKLNLISLKSLRFPIVSGDSLSAMADSVGFGLVKVASLLSQIKPQICVVHGDRFDAFSAVVAANLMDIVATLKGASFLYS